MLCSMWSWTAVCFDMLIRLGSLGWWPLLCDSCYYLSFSLEDHHHVSSDPLFSSTKYRLLTEICTWLVWQSVEFFDLSASLWLFIHETVTCIQYVSCFQSPPSVIKECYLLPPDIFVSFIIFFIFLIVAVSTMMVGCSCSTFTSIFRNILCFKTLLFSKVRLLYPLFESDESRLF